MMSKKKKKTHDDLVRHFQLRCKERLGYVLTQKFLKEELANRRLPFHSKQSNTRTRYILPRKWGRDLVVVYDKIRHAFVTVLFLYEMGKHDFEYLKVEDAENEG